ncbi:hypothetical protein DPMN_149655 [Dreissena polymorpha]|uniref:Sushi domain-containing protein n=1 Tax=Dreissena polymorpha TaxID=45954 RepID=A0A9D4FC08_DREPO|nr:hypothetical protein DPMN_149655 [Dreissena polymorpha]
MDGRRLGSQCSFTCQEGASLKGDNIVYCDAWNSSDILYGKWTFGSSQPFCERKSHFKYLPFPVRNKVKMAMRKQNKTTTAFK